ncbi:MAG TPA: DUF4440 domain-containing protein [Acidobacteriaceae bacterium]|nr:DUF4440 domain-containing protein [Acidobacteriaceae bacterium]
MRMFRYTTMAGLLSATLAVYAAPCRAPAAKQTQPATEAALRAVSDLWVQVLPTQNRDLLNCILSDDYMDSDWQGQLRTKTMMLDGLTSKAKMRENIQIEKIRVMQDIGLIWGINRVEDSSGKAIVTLRFTDVYAYRHQRWMAVASQETPLQQGSH